MRNVRLNILIVFLFVVGAKLSAQVNTLHYMTDIPQSYYLNPATQPGCDFFIGIPMISSQYFDLENSTLDFNDIFWTNPESGELIHPFHPNANLDEFLAKFEDENYIRGDWAANLFSFGFRIKQFYFTFDAVSKTTQRFTYPGSLVEFLSRGGPNDTEFDFSALGLDFTEHIEYGVGFSMRISDELQVGIRPKLLTGIAAMKWNNNDLSLYTSYEEWVLTSNLNMNMCLPGIIVPADPDGTIDFERGFEFDSTINSVSEYQKLLTKNLGFGVDFGAHFFPMDELQLSLSVQDLGFIKWKNYTHNFSMNGSYSYIGAELDPSDTSFTFNVLDSLVSSLDITSAPTTFKTTLEPKIFVGARYFLLPQFDVGFVHRFDFPEEGFKYSLTLLADYRPTSMFSLSGSYTPIGGNARSFGLGLALRIGPINAYLVTDYITTQYRVVKGYTVLLDGLNHYTFRAGINFVFGCNEKKKLRKDKPMYFSDEY